MSRLVIVAVLVGMVTALAGPALAAKPPVEFTLASCCVTEEVMRREIIPGFISYWKAKTGQEVTINPTFAGSGTLKNQILGGSPVQVGVFSSELYPLQLKEKGLITSDWRKAKNDGVVARSVIVILTREKNPKGFKGFGDLAKPGIQVIHSSPATSGGAQWSIYSIYGAVLRESEARTGKKDFAAAKAQLTAVEKNVIAMPESAAQAVAQFNSGFGDALVTYENEALVERAKNPKLAIVVPTSTITTTWTAARIDRNIKPEQEGVVNAFIEYLSSEPAQKAFAKYDFRSTIPAITKANDAKYADVELPFDIEYLGGTVPARKEIIDAIWQKAIKP
ncbi:MAG: extracellular solute-binding protein [Methanocella sp.]